MSSGEKDFHFDLEANAEDSLSHGIDHFLEAQQSGNSSHLKYTILHTFHATELFLKARLARAHPSLIFQKPENAHQDDPKTVDFDTLLGRLVSSSVRLDDEDVKDLNQLRRVRNKIEHHRISFSLEQAQAYVGRAMRFLDEFLKEHLEFSLKEKLPQEKYHALEQALYSYEERLGRATESASQNEPFGSDAMEWKLLTCLECGEDTVCPDPEADGKCRCHFCNSRFQITYCPRCGIEMFDQNEESYIECGDCIDYRMKED